MVITLLKIVSFCYCTAYLKPKPANGSRLEAMLLNPLALLAPIWGGLPVLVVLPLLPIRCKFRWGLDTTCGSMSELIQWLPIIYALFNAMLFGIAGRGLFINPLLFIMALLYIMLLLIKKLFIEPLIGSHFVLDAADWVQAVEKGSNTGWGGAGVLAVEKGSNTGWGGAGVLAVAGTDWNADHSMAEAAAAAGWFLVVPLNESNDGDDEAAVTATGAENTSNADCVVGTGAESVSKDDASNTGARENPRRSGPA